MTVADRIRSGALPSVLEGGDWRNYAGRDPHPLTLDGWCRAWWSIAYVRLQGFERDADAEAAYDDWARTEATS